MKKSTRPFFLNLTLLELLLLIAGGFLAVWLLLEKAYFNARNWDVLLYLHTAMHPSQEAWILNRYIHIYIQRLFIYLADEPFQAAKLFWAFQVVVSGGLVYINAKLLSSKNTILNGLLAVLFFFSNRILYIYNGTPGVDFSVMLWVSVAITIYVIYLKSKKRSYFLLVLLGMVQFFALKSKETGIIIFVLLLGTLFVDEFSWKDSFKKIGYIFVGGISGVVVLMVLDGLILGDSLFALRPESWKTLVNFTTSPKLEFRPDYNWYRYIFESMMVVPFIFILLGIKEKAFRERFALAERFIWLLPLALVALLSLLIIRGSFYPSARYLLSFIPVVSILGAQYFQITENQNWRFYAISVALGLGIVLVLQTVIYPYAVSLPMYWQPHTFHRIVIVSLALTAIFALIFFEEYLPIRGAFLYLPFVLIILVFPVLNIGYEIDFAADRARFVISPFAVFAEHLTFTETTDFYFSENLTDETSTLCRSDSSCRFMLNTYFNQQISLSAVTYSDDLRHLLEHQQTYAFITLNDWQSLGWDDDLLALGYQVSVDDKSEVVLLFKPDIEK